MSREPNQSFPDQRQPVSSLTPDPRNARTHHARNLELLRQSLQELGAARSIVVDETGTILAGNATVQAAQDAGITTVRVIDADGTELIAVRRSGLTAKQKQRVALFDNRTAELADWDSAVLASLNDELDLSDLWTRDELAELLAAAPDVVFPEYDATAAESVAQLECPACGHRFPR